MKRVVFAFVAPVFLACLAATTLSAETCPQAPDHSDALNALYDQVQAATNEGAARQISDQMWSLWADAPNEQAQAILDRGMSQRAGYDFAGALSSFDRLTEYCPNYAEGYNQRAFVHYLRQDYAAALVDLDRSIVMSPDHVAALSGKALSLLALGRLDEARVVLAQALRLNPWLPERNLAQPGGPLSPPGTDL